MDRYPTNAFDTSAQFFDVAAGLHDDLIRRFGAHMPLGKVEQAISPEHFIGRMQGTNPGAELNIIKLRSNFDALKSATGQTVGLMRYIPDTTGKIRSVINPAILEGATPDGTGLRLTYLSDELSLNAPLMTPLQDVVLRASMHLHAEGVGTDAVDTTPAAPLESGHTYMGLRAVTDPAVVAAIQRASHPVHDWKKNGIAETVTRPLDGMGMFDVQTQKGLRKVQVHHVVLHEASPTALVHHISYSNKGAYEKETGLTADRIALGIGVVAAQSHEIASNTLKQTVFSTLGRLQNEA